MSNPAPICTHIKTDGIRCGSPAEGGTEFCYHHSAVKRALGKAPAQAAVGSGGFAPLPFVFPEDRASMQINYFLLLQAFNEGRVDLRYFKVMMSLLKSMAKNLGKTGSLVEETRAQGSGRRAQEDNRQQRSADRESLALSAAAEKRGRVAEGGRFSMGPDYGFLRSATQPKAAMEPKAAVMPWEVGSGSDPIKEMARQAARVRW